MNQALFSLCDSESAPQLRGTAAAPRKVGVTSAVSDESVAGDSGVYEPSERKYRQFFLGLDVSQRCVNIQTCHVCVLKFDYDEMFASPPGRASLQTSSWAPTRGAW